MSAAVARLNWGCGPCVAPGWINSDRISCKGVDVCCDIRSGLPLAAECMDYAVAIHVLQDLSWPDIAAALRELHRVLRPGGVLRLGLPDLDRRSTPTSAATKRISTSRMAMREASAQSSSRKSSGMDTSAPERFLELIPALTHVS